jgi:predicted CoA-binding protein
MTDAAPRFEHGFPERPEDHNVVVLGASPKPGRYASMAQRQLMEQGYRVIPVHPKVEEIQGVPVVHSLRVITDPVHTLTLYVGAARMRPMLEDIIRLNPRRVIFNPGSECPELETLLRQHHIPHVHGCTLVMLRTRQF